MNPGDETDHSEDTIFLGKEDTAFHVYKGLWNEFYDWEQSHCLQTLQSLERPAAYPEDFPQEEKSDYYSLDSFDEYTEWFLLDGLNEVLPLKLHLEEEEFHPHSSHTMCTPSSSNAHPPKGFIETAPFIPFADNKFGIQRYLLLFGTFGWQTDFWDPDREMIYLEMARRLHYGHGFSFSEIDNLGFHYVELYIHGSAGMVWEVSQRDQLLWPGSQMSILPDLVKYVRPTLNFHETLTAGIVSFCDNLNCLLSVCFPHHESHPIIAVNPKKTSERLGSTNLTPCNRDCFKSYLSKDTDFELSDFDVSWHPDDLAIFSSAVRFVPDSCPCDLAVICRKSCIQTYIQRCKLISDDEIQNTEKEESLAILEPNITISNDQSEDRVKPCYHPGEQCNQSNCPCYNKQQRCERMCRCPKKCYLRFKGCNCKGSKPCAGDSSCPCRDSGRECDPEKCISCDSRFAKGSHACRNTVLQRGNFTKIWVHGSKFGLGAFALQKIEAGKCIGDYLGDIITDGSAVTMIRKFSHRNYAFGMTKMVTLDSHSLGNDTRYLNHSDHPNCEAKQVLVNGDLKTGIYSTSTIKKGQELFLDYGINYWEGDNASEPEYD